MGSHILPRFRATFDRENQSFCKGKQQYFAYVGIITIGSPTVADPRGAGGGLVREVTAFQGFYELEVALEI